MKFNCDLLLETDTPCFKGHFPGNPITPGALLLSHVAMLCKQHCHQDVIKVSKVKFASPLMPNDKARLELNITENTKLKFAIMCGETTILSGKGLLSEPRENE